ncbi:MAG TPA: hypothetical protein VFF73_31205 [Planctomycetota bacterium]|nr:hypothetical protein [Planctomycetota bacterium]
MKGIIRSFSVLATLALGASLCRADGSAPAGTYRYDADSESGTWLVSTSNGIYSVSATANGKTWTAGGTLQGNVLTVTRKGTPGVTGAVSEGFGENVPPGHDLVYEATFDGAFANANGTIYDQAPNQGARTKIAALKLAQKALADGGVWVETTIAGGPTVDFTTSVPGPIPELTFTAGLKASALVLYTADDLYPVSADASSSAGSSKKPAAAGAASSESDTSSSAKSSSSSAKSSSSSAPSSPTAKPPATASKDGGIFAAAEKDVQAAIDLAETLDKTGSVDKSWAVGPYGHLGVELSTRVLSETTGFMAGGLADLTGGKKASKGGAKAPPSEAIEALLNALRSEPARVFSFPRTGDDALALPEGTRRIVQGQATIVVSGGADLGLTPDMLKNLAKTTLAKTKVASIAQADVSATIQAGVTGELRLFIERQDASNVLLVWSTGIQSSVGASLDGQVGIDLTQLWKDASAVPPSVQDKVNAKIDSVLSWGDKTFSFGINGSADWLKQKNFAAKLLLDVSTADGKQAYAAAVKGDLTTAKKLAQNGQNKAVKYEIVSSNGTERLLDFGLHVGKLTFDREDDKRSGEIDVDLDGGKLSIANKSESKKYTTFLHGNQGKVEEVGTTRTMQNPDGTTVVEKRASYVFTSAEKKPDAQTSVNYQTLANEIFGAGTQVKAAPTSASSQVELVIELDDAAVKTLLDPDQTTLSAFYTAMGQAEYGPEMMRTKNDTSRGALQPYDWSSGLESKDASSDEQSAFKRATEIWNVLHQAPKNGQAADPLDLFAQAAKKAGDDPAAFIAFAKLAGTSHALVKMAVDTVPSSGQATGVWNKSVGQAPALVKVTNPLGEALGQDPLVPGDPSESDAPTKGPAKNAEAPAPSPGAEQGPIVWGTQIDATHWNATVMGRPAIVQIGVNANGQYSMIVTFKNG